MKERFNEKSGHSKAVSNKCLHTISNCSHVILTLLYPLLSVHTPSPKLSQQVLHSSSQTPFQYPRSSCSSCCPLLIHYKAQAGPLQSCAWSFLTACQLVAKDFQCLSLPPLSLIYQICVSVCFSFSSPSYDQLCTERVLDWITLMKQMLSPSTYPYTGYKALRWIVNWTA